LTEEDLIYLDINLEVLNARKPYAYTPKYPAFKEENWHILILNEKNEVMFYKLVTKKIKKLKYLK
jgi:hypothetical protein